MSVQTAAVLFLLGLAVWGVSTKFGKVLAALVAIAIVAMIVIGYSTLLSFQTLSGRTLVATVKASQVANVPHEMVVEMTTGGHHTSYELGGDRWQLQCQTIELNPWELAIGLKSGYQLSRISGQYDAAQEGSVPVQLGSWGWFNGLENNIGLLSPVVKSAYSSAVIDPMGTYNVYVDSAGDLLAERA